MKHTKTCPKCGCTDILRVEDAVGDRSINLVLGWMSAIPVARYVCCDCGYVESWADKRDLYQLRERLEKQRKK